MSEGSARRVIQRPPSRAPLIGVAIAALALVGAALVPPLAMPVSTAPDIPAVASRACPTVDDGASLGVAVATGEVAAAPVPTPTQSKSVASGAVVALEATPVRLTGPVERGFTGVAAAWSGPGPDQGLSLATCATPRSEVWLTGVRSDDASRSDLVLINLDVTPADVNVSVYGPDGPIAAAGARGVEVAGQSTRSLPLAPIVNSPSPVTLEVRSSAGRVAAYVRERDFSGIDPRGANWISAVPSPDAAVVVPAVPGGSGARTLVVGNPGDRTAQVQVQALAGDGAFVPVGLDSVDVPAGTTRTFPLETALKGQSVAIRLTASQPVVAAVEARLKAAWAVRGASAGVGAGVSATIPLPKGVTPQLMLVNPTDQPAQADVLITDASGKQLAKRSVDLAASGTAVVDPGAATAALVTVTTATPSLRVGMVVTGSLNKVAVLGSLALQDASGVAPSVVMVRDPLLGT